MIYLIILIMLLSFIFIYEIIIFSFSLKLFNKTFLSKNVPPESKRKLLTSPNKKQVLTYDNSFFDKYNFEIIETTSFDNIVLKAHFLKKDNSHKYILAVHGYHGSYKELSIPCRYLYEKENFNLVMIEQRGHFSSKAKYITFGVNESKDILKWIEKIIQIDEKAQICIYGFSMGASSVLNTLGYNLPSNVKCAISDSGYSSIKEELFSTLKRHVKSKIILESMFINMNFIANIHHFSLKKINPITQLANNNTPLLLIHGKEDTLVPYYMQEKIYKANNKKTYIEKVSFDNAWHGMSFIISFDEYMMYLKNFLNKFIN